MGQAKRRGTFEEQKAAAITAGRIKKAKTFSNDLPSTPMPISNSLATPAVLLAMAGLRDRQQRIIELLIRRV